MVYSKFLKQSNIFIGRSIKYMKYTQNDGSYVLNKTNKVVSWGSSYSMNNYQYSTLLNSKSSDSSNLSLKSKVKPCSSVAFMSTNGTNEKYQVIVTNPTEGVSTTLNSSLSSASEISNVEEISDLPTTSLTDIAPTLTEGLSSAVDVIEPSLASIGLAHWTPPGFIQMILEQMHIGMHWPWWLAIVTSTVIARILLFPILLKTQRSTINMSNHMPQLQFLQMKFGEARRSGNTLEAAKYANEMTHFMKDKNINPLKTSMLPLMQAPVFLSFFFGLRAMANAPVESMKEGGLSWITDLTVPDPYYVLPLVACGTLYVVLKIGAESGVRMENLKMAKYLLQALPVIALPFCINFPAAVLFYWCTNNFCTLAVVSFLKIKPVRQYFNLPNQQAVDPKYVLPKKGFVKGVKEAYEDQKILATVEERRRMDSIKFQKAGTGPIPRTYSYDPTKPRPSNVAAAASKSMTAKQHKP